MFNSAESCWLVLSQYSLLLVSCVVSYVFASTNRFGACVFVLFFLHLCSVLLQNQFANLSDLHAFQATGRRLDKPDLTAVYSLLY